MRVFITLTEKKVSVIPLPPQGHPIGRPGTSALTAVCRPAWQLHSSSGCGDSQISQQCYAPCSMVATLSPVCPMPGARTDTSIQKDPSCVSLQLRWEGPPAALSGSGPGKHTWSLLLQGAVFSYPFSPGLRLLSLLSTSSTSSCALP